MSNIKSLKILQIFFSVVILIFIVLWILGNIGITPLKGAEGALIFPSLILLGCVIAYLSIAWSHRKELKLIDKVFVVVILIPLIGPFLAAFVDVFK